MSNHPLICHTCNKTTSDLTSPMKKCGRCKTTAYCSVECQRQDWKHHKPTCRDPSLPSILIIAVGESASLLESTASHLLAGLRRFASVVISESAADAAKLLADAQGLRAVILADGEALGPKKFKGLREKVVAYAKGGGTLILGTTFACFTGLDAFNGFMRDSLNLPWEFGDYHRTVVYLNSGVSDARFKGVGLAGSYSQKAVFLKNVAMEDRVYGPSEQSVTQSMVFGQSPVDQQQVPVCWKKIGEGWLGYVGDVNCEDESTAVTLAMCGLA